MKSSDRTTSRDCMMTTNEIDLITTGEIDICFILEAYTVDPVFPTTVEGILWCVQLIYLSL